MNRLTKLALLGLALVGMLGLSACGDVQTSKGFGGASYDEFSVTLTDGRSMPCIGNSHGVNCDWANLK